MGIVVGERPKHAPQCSAADATTQRTPIPSAPTVPMRNRNTYVIVRPDWESVVCLRRVWRSGWWCLLSCDSRPD